MAKLKLLLLFLLGAIGVSWSQCDLEIIGFDIETFDITIAVNSGYGCSNPNVSDYDPFDDSIYDLIIGIQTIAEDDPYPCFWEQNPTTSEYGWVLINIPLDLPGYEIGQGPDNVLNTGDTLTFNLVGENPQETQEPCLTEAFESGYFDDCSQIVIYQINDSNGSLFWDGYFVSSIWEEGDDFPYPEVYNEDQICILGATNWASICNNQLTFSTSPTCGGPPPPPLPEGCMDPDASNYNSEAVLDDGSCIFIDVNVFYALLQFDCDSTTNLWTFYSTIKFNNNSDVAIDNWCVQGYIDGDVNNPFYDECFNITVEAGETYQHFMPEIITPTSLGYELPLNSITYVVYGVEGETNLNNNDMYLWDNSFIYYNCIQTGCTDIMACNYDETANAGNPEEECNYPDECGECDGEETGPGAIYDCGCEPLEEGACDCDGNEPYDLFQCDCEGTPDLDQDGICDEEDDCVGYIDECGVCNGPGAIYECGCFDTPEGDCDCLGNILDGCGICGGEGVDIDGDGLCDDIDDCVGEYDACGVCNGPGEVYECGCSDIPEGDCDCDGNVLDACGVCGGDGIPNGYCDCDYGTWCWGCTDSEADNYNIIAGIDDGSCIYCQTNIWIPNTVTPNNDGVNDVWKVVTNYPDCWMTWETYIYNRWGQLVWYSEDITEPWIVNVQGGQYYVSDGVYVYLVRGVTWDLTDFVWDKTGHITVFR